MSTNDNDNDNGNDKINVIPAFVCNVKNNRRISEPLCVIIFVPAHTHMLFSITNIIRIVWFIYCLVIVDMIQFFSHSIFHRDFLFFHRFHPFSIHNKLQKVLMFNDIYASCFSLCIFFTWILMKENRRTYQGWLREKERERKIECVNAWSNLVSKFYDKLSFIRTNVWCL